MKTTLNVFLAAIMMIPRIHAKNRMAPRKIMLSLGLIMKDMTMLHTSMRGALTATLMHI